MQSSDPTTDMARREAESRTDDLQQLIHKRMTLNLLIQGAAAHAFLTTQHLVSDELEAIQPGLTKLYDKLVVSCHLSYWVDDFLLFYGSHSRYWRRLCRPGQPLHEHRLLSKHGEMLSLKSKQHLLQRGKKKGATGIPILHYMQMMRLMFKTRRLERDHKEQLVKVAKQATSRIWGIEEDRLDAELTTKVAFGNINSPQTVRGKIMRAGVIGYGGVERREGQFYVVAKSWIWQLLLHELVKGTAELICLHGLNSLDDKTYASVTAEADRLEYELWALQAGPEIWRRLLAVLPDDRPLAEMLMHIARLDPRQLEHLMLAVIEEPEHAQSRLAMMAGGPR